MNGNALSVGNDFVSASMSPNSIMHMTARPVSDSFSAVWPAVLLEEDIVELPTVPLARLVNTYHMLSQMNSIAPSTIAALRNTVTPLCD
jgi:hypothetical protein